MAEKPESDRAGERSAFWSRRDALRAGAAGLGARLLPGVAGLGLAGLGGRARAEWSGGGVRSHGETLVGEIKYGPDFKHVDYVNPDAPKGGRARMSFSFQFDTFNRFNGKGRPAPAVSLVFEQLFEPTSDESSAAYGLLAEWMEAARDDSWVAFRLRDEARWHDGRPVTVADVQKSFELLTTQGSPLWRFYYADVEQVVDEGDRIVRFRFSTDQNRELPHILGQLYVFPAHWWAERDFTASTLEPPLGSGPYRIVDFEEGRSVECARVEDYWGVNVPIRVGHYNFDVIRFEHFLDRDAEFEAFKKGDIDFWRENTASRWAQRFDFPAIRRGHVIRETREMAGPKRVQGFVFNTRREKFADRRVREALSIAYDFEWTRSKVYFDQYDRAFSYFQGTDDLMALGAPDEGERTLLAPFADQLPPGLLEKPFEQPVSDGSGRHRRGLRQAARLLREAGLTIDDGRLFDANGEPFTLEFLIGQASLDAVARPYLQNLEKLGIETSLRSVDRAQYELRERTYDFDMVIDTVANSESPGNEQREYWGSAAADAEGGRNMPGVKNPVVDALIETIVFAKDRAALGTASRALDRVLLWERYLVLNFYEPPERIAYWNRFGRPETPPSHSLGFPSVWWWDEEKAAAL